MFSGVFETLMPIGFGWALVFILFLGMLWVFACENRK